MTYNRSESGDGGKDSASLQSDKPYKESAPRCQPEHHHHLS